MVDPLSSLNVNANNNQSKTVQYCDIVQLICKRYELITTKKKIYFYKI